MTASFTPTKENEQKCLQEILYIGIVIFFSSLVKFYLFSSFVYTVLVLGKWELWELRYINYILRYEYFFPGYSSFLWLYIWLYHTIALNTGFLNYYYTQNVLIFRNWWIASFLEMHFGFYQVPNTFFHSYLT